MVRPARTGLIVAATMVAGCGTPAAPTSKPEPIAAGLDAGAVAVAVIDAPVDAATYDPALDQRPGDLTIEAPLGDFAVVAAPADAPVAAPADGWWKAGKPCPKGKGSKLATDEVEGHNGHIELAYHCVGGGKLPRPYTVITIDGDQEQREDGWIDGDEERHGLIRQVDAGGFETRGMYSHGIPVGRHERWASAAGPVVQSWHHRADGALQGLASDTTTAVASSGYYAANRKVGTWLAWEQPDVIRASLYYVEGVLEGDARWWYADGAVLARGRFEGGIGRWDVLTPRGKRRSRNDCVYGRTAEVWAWDDAGELVVHSCAPDLVSQCAAELGPPDGDDRVALGADDDLCAMPELAPLDQR